MKKILISTISVLFIYTLICFLAPPIIEKGRNKVALSKPYNVSAKAKKLYHSLGFIADLHCDALLWDRDLTERSDYGHVDLPRLRDANVAFQAFTIVTKSPKGQNVKENSAEAFDNITPLSIVQGQPIDTWYSLFARASYQTSKLQEIEDDNENFVIIRSRNDFQQFLTNRKTTPQLVSGLLGVEGGHCLEGNVENLDKLYNLGVRMLGPTHFFDNKLGGSAHGITREGLTHFGRSVIKRMNEIGMVVDLSHISSQMIDEILLMSDKPVIVSHIGVKGIVNSSRNLSDHHIKAIASRNGLIGVGFFSTAIGNTGVKGIVKTMKYIKDLVGAKYVALGSDYDGSVTVPFDVTGLPLLIDEMTAQGFSTQEIKLIMGENVKRFWLRNLK